MAAAASVALGAGLFAGLGSTPGVASSHREAPLTAADPQIDQTDLYAFVSPDAPTTVTLVSSWIPFEEPGARRRRDLIRTQRSCNDPQEPPR